MTTEATQADRVDTQPSFVLAARIVVALIQAAWLYGLNQAGAPKVSWPATDAGLFDALLLIGVFTPLVCLVGLGKVRALWLTVWGVVVTIVVGTLGWYGAARGSYVEFARDTVRMPDFQLWLALIGTVFVAHVLFIDSILERQLMPPYARHFDTAWKQCVQLLLAAAFTLVFWGVLWLGAMLFKAINIDLFDRILSDRWFQYPATTLAVAVSLHVTDVQPSLIRGARTLALTLFSWLLPLLAAILLAFLVSLPFMSLTVLWKTHFAGSLMLTAAGLLILLINSCYQDGASEQTTSRIKRIATMVAAVELVPVVGLAAWALALRVEQYGWSVQRIFAAAITFAEAGYALGYASAVVRAPVWMKRIEVVNFAAACVVIALVIALFSPIADPGRIMVADQMARLRSGVTKADSFDYWALKGDGAHWGVEALTSLSHAITGPNANMIGLQAKRALSAPNRFSVNQQRTPDGLNRLIAVYPDGRSLPPDLVAFIVGPEGPQASICADPSSGNRCTARFVTLSPNQPEAVLISTPYTSWLFQRDEKGDWAEYPLIAPTMACGAIAPTDPIQVLPHDQPDIVSGNRRFIIGQKPVSCTSTGPVSVGVTR